MTPTSLAKIMQTFFTEYLPMQRNVSPHTVRSYRDVMTLLLRFCRDRKGLAIERLRIEQLSAELVIEFLDSLETDRGCSIRTRNQRLAALHAFMRYLQVEAPEHILHCQRLLAIPFKRYDRPHLTLSHCGTDAGNPVPAGSPHADRKARPGPAECAL